MNEQTICNRHRGLGGYPPRSFTTIFQHRSTSITRNLVGPAGTASRRTAFFSSDATAADSQSMTADEIRRTAPSIASSKLRVMLAALKQDGLMRECRGPKYERRPEPLTTPTEPLVAAYDERRQRDQHKLEQIVVYAQTPLCRTHVLLEALGETVEWSHCGTCDNCSSPSIRSEAVAVGAA